MFIRVCTCVRRGSTAIILPCLLTFDCLYRDKAKYCLLIPEIPQWSEVKYNRSICGVKVVEAVATMDRSRLFISILLTISIFELTVYA